MKRLFTFTWIVVAVFFMDPIGRNAYAEDALQSSAQIKITSDIPFSEGIQVRDAIRNECTLGVKLSDFIKEYGSDYDLNIQQLADIANEQGKVLHVEISDVTGAGGGAWSGPKFVTIKGSLTENGTEVGTFRASRHSGGGAFGGFKSTCAILGRDVKALGKDVAKWLKSPTMDAALGDG